MRALGNQEQAAYQQDEVASRHLLAKDREKRLDQPHHPRQRKEQDDAHNQSEAEADESSSGLLFRRQLSGEDRDKNYVVDAEHELEQREREKSDPDLRVGEPIHARISPFVEI